MYPDIECYKCKQRGHYKGQCPSKNTKKGINALQIDENKIDKYDIMFAQYEALTHDIPKSWVLLDSQSTVSVFNNAGMSSPTFSTSCFYYGARYDQ